MILRVRILGVIGEAQPESFLIPSTKSLEWHARFPDQISKVMQSVFLDASSIQNIDIWILTLGFTVGGTV